MKFKNNNTLQLIGRHNFTHSLLTRIFSGISIFIICRLAYLYLLPHFFDISLIKEFRTDQIDTFLSRDFSNNRISIATHSSLYSVNIGYCFERK